MPAILVGLRFISALLHRGYQETTDQDAAHQRDLQSSWQNMEYHRRQQEADTFGTSIQSSRQASRLSRQMEVQVELQQMLIDIAGYTSDRFLGYAGKDSITELLEHGCTDSGCTIYTCEFQGLSSLPNSLQATIMEPATVHAVPPTARKSMFIVSTMLLK